MKYDDEESTAVAKAATRLLTKGDIQSVVQCPRKLWLEHHRRDLAPAENTMMDRRAIDGEIVGAKAREDLGPEFIWPKAAEDKYEAMRAARRQMYEFPDLPVVEMPMVHAGLYTRADALIPEGDAFILRETKASTYPLKKDKVTTDKADEHYLFDVAIQAWVMDGAGIPLARSELNLLNNRWHYAGDENYKGLFRQLDVSAEVEERKPFVPIWLAKANEVLDGPMPECTTGDHCKKPYDCPFKDHCKALDPPAEAHPIELLPDSAGKKLAKKLKLEKGYTSLLQPSPEELKGKQIELYLRIQKAHRTGEAILEPGADVLMANLPYPRYYFDFEGIDLPVPRWAGIRPYEQIPFQWSCHIEREPGVFEHHAFLDLSGDDPSLPCIKRMLEVIDPNGKGPILVFYQTYEKGRLQELADRHPEYADEMEKYIERLVDLHPMVKDHFYDPRMKGSFSIKKVLPVIAPDLDYKELEDVQEGTGAQVAYLNICFEMRMPEADKKRVRGNLLAYCDQDTWAMVEVGYFLERKPRPLGLRPPSATEC